MTELFAIILQFFIFLIISSFPLNKKNLNSLLGNKKNSFNYIDCHAVNIIILFNILLISSFLNINLRIIFIVIFLSSLILVVIRWKEILLLINKKNIIKFIFFFIITISIFISTAYSLKLEWDGFHWITKALVFFNDTNIQNLQYSRMSEYPHLGGFIWAFFWKNSILELEYFGRLFYVYFYLISIFTIFNVLNFKSQKITFILIFSLIFITYDPYLFAGYQDYLIFSTFLISSRFISTISFTKTIEYRKIFFIFFIMSIAMWFKDEGAFYFLIFGSLLIVLNKDSLRNKVALISIILLVMFTQFYLQKNIIGIFGFNVEFVGQTTINQLLDIKLLLIKCIGITKHMAIAFIKYPLWLLVIFALIFNKEKSYLSRYLIYAFILNILFIYAVYLHDPNTGEFILSVTLDRVMFQTSGFYILAFILMLNKNNLIKSKF